MKYSSFINHKTHFYQKLTTISEAESKLRHVYYDFSIYVTQYIQWLVNNYSTLPTCQYFMKVSFWTPATIS